MKFSFESAPNTNIFKQAIVKCLNENKQLIFSKKLTICQNKMPNGKDENKEDNNDDFPLVEISDIKDIIDIPNSNDKLTGIICFFDNRHHL